jgi:hypothetical protein
MRAVAGTDAITSSNAPRRIPLSLSAARVNAAARQRCLTISAFRRIDRSRGVREVSKMALGRTAMLSATAALVLCGCGGGDPAAAQAASSFGAALGAGDLTRACELLAPATRATVEYQQSRVCPQAMQQDNLSAGAVLQVEVWGGEARARTSSDTWFLTRTTQGWRVAAAGCVSQAQDAPYMCKVSGP